MVNEFAPRSRRATMVTMMSIGFAVGAAGGGQLNAILLPLIGWRGTFCVGGFLPLILVVALMRYLPESLRYLVVQGGREAEIARVLKLMVPDLRLMPGTSFAIHHGPGHGDGQPRRARVLELFTRERVAITLLLWLAVCLNLLTMNFLNNWLPSVLTGAGLTVAQAVRATTLFQCGGIVGVLAMGWITDRIGFFPVLIISFAMQAVVACSIALGGGSIPVLVAAVPAAGLFVIGVNNMLSALTATLYPTAIRATGTGWANCFGHLGAITGPVIGGILLGLHWPIGNLFFLLAAVPAVGTCVMATMAAFRVRQQRLAVPVAEPARQSA
jgi:AAHS family 4-hydroxybenzoate transporter-like MFS transporter